MKVLVTGASGYVGDKLCHTLSQRGYSVRALVRNTSDISSLPPSDFEIAYGDITHYASLLDAFHGCDAVFHAAAITDMWLPDPSKFFTVNVEGMRNVVQAAKETTTIKKIVCTLSASALGPTDGYAAEEKKVHSGLKFSTEYERSQVAALKVAMEAVATEGAPIVVVYLGVVYGPGKLTSGNLTAQMLIEYFKGGLLARIGFGKDVFSLSHIDDAVQGHIAAMERGEVGETYLLTGENTSFARVIDLASTITAKAKPRMTIPFWVIEILGWLAVLHSRITGQLPLISPPAVDALRREWEYSCDKARTQLGYNPRGLEDGLVDVLMWLKAIKLIDY
ncbi:Putative dihydroflavonol 4-reductase [Linum grandiflorum]